ncbi:MULTISPECIES: hypothetical protein [unclassified Methanosarcina]|uniref:hypothetical protein n=1 Tax=unclassified Methanosarcina TaxID=2644672 RepID=UPI0025F04CB1|nr:MULTISPECIES: hypothetical protein [unclassified Methanosarcina]
MKGVLEPASDRLTGRYRKDSISLFSAEIALESNESPRKKKLQNLKIWLSPSKPASFPDILKRVVEH